jgi:hypothetical protein
MLPLNLAIGPTPPLTRKLGPPGTAAPASPAQPWTGMACYGPLNRENHEKMMINSRQGGRGDRITSVCCGRFQRRSFGFRGPQVRIHNPYISIHESYDSSEDSWKCHHVIQWSKLQNCLQHLQLTQSQGHDPLWSCVASLSFPGRAFATMASKRFSISAAWVSSRWAYRIPRLYSPIYPGYIWWYYVILSPYQTIQFIYVIICYVNLCQFHRKTQHQLPNLGLDSVRSPLPWKNHPVSPPCDGLGVAPSFQAPALPPKRSVRNCLSEQSVPTAIIGKL